jgi:V8-like Glu-specific endopeptidase
MGKESTFLPISFLEVGTQRSRSVARVRLAGGAAGTGILTRNNILVTNHHVIANQEQASGAVVQFNYQQTALGLDVEPTPFSLEPDSGFATSAEDDWTLVRVSGDPNLAWGAIEIGPVDVAQRQHVNIIQHPGGGPKQIALYHNIVAYADEKRIQYLTDTLPGSSGSPVFDDQWRVVALHHSGGWILEPGTKEPVFRNEGININIVVAALKNNGLV